MAQLIIPTTIILVPCVANIGSAKNRIKLLGHALIAARVIIIILRWGRVQIVSGLLTIHQFYYILKRGSYGLTIFARAYVTTETKDGRHRRYSGWRRMSRHACVDFLWMSLPFRNALLAPAPQLRGGVLFAPTPIGKLFCAEEV